MTIILSKYWHVFLLFIITGLSFGLRIYNLNYNSPFNDEAIYIVLGRLGIFQGDWWIYNAASWMAGQPYVYPSMTAIAYMSGGIVASRVLNVLIGLLAIESMFALTYLISPGTETQKRLRD